MTEEEKKQIQEEYNSKTTGQLIIELFRLIGLLIIKIIYKFIQVVARFVQFIIEAILESFDRLVEWWNDNSTQQKIAKTREKLNAAKKKIWEWSIIAFWATVKAIKVGSIATWHGLQIGTKATIDGFIHMKPTVIKLGHLTVDGFKAFCAWLKRCGRGIKLSNIKRKRAYQRFRRNKGFKGLIIDSSTAVKDGIKMFMEEDQQEATPDAVTEDDLLQEELDERADEGSKAHKIGRKIFATAKNIMNED